MISFALQVSLRLHFTKYLVLQEKTQHNDYSNCLIGKLNKLSVFRICFFNKRKCKTLTH